VNDILCYPREKCSLGRKAKFAVWTGHHSDPILAVCGNHLASTIAAEAHHRGGVVFTKMLALMGPRAHQLKNLHLLTWDTKRCQVVACEKLQCDHQESGGQYCEVLGPHTKHGYSEHTINHERYGNGYACSAIPGSWEPR